MYDRFGFEGEWCKFSECMGEEGLVSVKVSIMVALTNLKYVFVKFYKNNLS